MINPYIHLIKMLDAAYLLLEEDAKNKDKSAHK
jgi:hypothetical protein